MEQLNHQVFLLINSNDLYSNGWGDYLAVFVAEWLVWALPLLLVYLWLCGDLRRKRAAVSAALSAALALCLGGFIGWLWPQPRPFMLDMGHLLISHAADASLPSDHLTLWWGIAMGLAYSTPTRRIGLLLTVAGLAPAWARIYVGVHFPADMLAALCVSLVSTRVVGTYGRALVTRITILGVQLQRALFRRHAHD